MKLNRLTLWRIVCVDFTPQIHQRTINCTIFYECMWSHPLEMMAGSRNNTPTTRQKQDPNMTMTDKHLTHCQKPYKSKWNAISVKWHDTLACRFCPMRVCAGERKSERVSEWVWIEIRNKTKIIYTERNDVQLGKKSDSIVPLVLCLNSQQKYGE